jgi:IS1 family transposase
MKLMGLFLFSVLAIFSSLLIDTPREQSLSDNIFAEQEVSPSSSSTLFQNTGLRVVWAEVNVLRRKQRPYRNPLRRLRKKLRKDKRMRRRLLKGNPEKDSSVEAAPLENEISQVEQQTENVIEVSEAEGAMPQRSKRGRKPTIETNHVFCPIEGCRGYLVVGPHPDHWIVGAGTYDTKSDNNHQMYRCKWCGERFSETRGTVFFGLKTPQETVYRALHSLCENMGIRAAARVFEVKPDTILLWLRRAGEHCEKVSAYLMRNLHVEQAQLEELWTFVFKKNKTLSAWEKLYTEYGDTWVWTAIDPTHKLVLSLVVGEHEEEQAVNLLQKLKAVVVNGCLPLLVSDQLPHYVQAILKVFGRWVQPQRNGNRGRFPNPRLEPTEDLHYARVNSV